MLLPPDPPGLEPERAGTDPRAELLRGCGSRKIQERAGACFTETAH